tara:strand:+ start:1300 stop:1974 length:675 start_codon:yes stop_codon:yes gene_type:complete
MKYNTNYYREFLKKIIFRYTHFGKPKYEFCIEPIQLSKIIESIENVLLDKRNDNSCFVEIGVARGMTSRFIAEHLRCTKIKKNFYCIDTFSSFTDEDLNFEVNIRGKSKRELLGFSYNDFEKWKENFKNFEMVKAIKADINHFDFSKIEKISFCFLDVDLYNPTKNALKNILPFLSENSIIMVDDVVESGAWDGAGQAFKEFVKEKSLDYSIVGNKCGLIKFLK